jgi:hypothetical protein
MLMLSLLGSTDYAVCLRHLQLCVDELDLRWFLQHPHRQQAVYDQEFVEVSLSKYKGKYVVLFF